MRADRVRHGVRRKKKKRKKRSFFHCYIFSPTCAGEKKKKTDVTEMHMQICVFKNVATLYVLSSVGGLLDEAKLSRPVNNYISPVL